LETLENNYGETTVSKLIEKYPEFNNIMVLCCMGEAEMWNTDLVEHAALAANVAGCVAQQGARGTAACFKVATIVGKAAVEGGEMAMKGVPLAGIILGFCSAGARTTMSVGATLCGTMSGGMLAAQLGLSVVEVGGGIASCWPGPGTVVALSLSGAVLAADAGLLAVGAMGGDRSALQESIGWEQFVGTWEERTTAGWFHSSVLVRKWKIAPNKVTQTYSKFRDASGFTITGERLCDGRLQFEIHFLCNPDSPTLMTSTWDIGPGGDAVCRPSGNKHTLTKED
jgi:hypothetical protein